MPAILQSCVATRGILAFYYMQEFFLDLLIAILANLIVANFAAKEKE